MEEGQSDLRRSRAAGSPTPAIAALAASRWPVTGVFFLNGLLLASYLVRLPSLKQSHEFNDGQMGLVGMLFALAALASMQFVGPLTNKYGSARMIRIALLVMPAALVGVGVAGSAIAFIALVVALGAVHGVLDVSMNAHAITMEKRRGRPILSGCHAAWSISAVTAAVVGAVMISTKTSTETQFLGLGILVVAIGLAIGPLLGENQLTADRASDKHGQTGVTAGQPAPGQRRGWTFAAVKLGLVGVLLMVVEGAALAWGGIYLREDRGASLALSSLVVIAFTGSQTILRVFGDRIRLRVGDPRVFRVGALVGAAGLAVAVLSPDPIGVVGGFAILGIGTSLLLPLTFGAVGRSAPTKDQAAAVSRFTTFTYAGILLGPAVIGWAAQIVGLSWTLAALIPLLAALAFAPK